MVVILRKLKLLKMVKGKKYINKSMLKKLFRNIIVITKKKKLYMANFSWCTYIVDNKKDKVKPNKKEMDTDVIILNNKNKWIEFTNE